ncbi:MAG: S8 family serine peptidase [Deltaproteobacteria bacterium]|nr:S8 family serine peptidase [Deltaproteobacteria bacterium]
MRLRAAWAALVLVPSWALAQPRAAPARPEATRVDPALAVLLRWRDLSRETHPLWRASERFAREGRLPVVVRFRAVDAGTLAQLAQEGVRWERAARPYASGAYGAWADARGIAALEAHGAVSSVGCDLPTAGPEPLERSARELRLDAATRALRASEGVVPDGSGVLIADLDSPVFVYHPMFFRADAGVFPWTDANGNARFDPGIDGVDLDGDGRLAPSERLQVLQARERDGAAPFGSLRLAEDWLYLDTNRDRRRDWGGAPGLRAPAYGEPLFVPDDADGDGVLAPSERLLRLGTSRFRAVVSAIDWRRDATAGPDLSQYDLSDLGDASRMDHATAVCGILAGGVPGLSRRAGVAPGAELLVIDHRALTERTGAVGGVQRALDEGARVLLTEFASYLGVTLDGTGELEQELDAAVTDGALAVSPTGNLAASGKHLRARLTAGSHAFTALPGEATEDVRGLFFSLHLRGAPRPLRFELAPPEGAPVWIPTDAMPRDYPGGARATGFRRRTVGGTEEWHLTVVAPERLQRGPWTLRVLVPEGTEGTAELYLGDTLNRWLDGYHFDANEPSSTLCNPSTSALTLAVGAYVLAPSAPSFGEAGSLAGYSSRGPRLDGLPGVSLTAPDSPVTAAPSLSRAQEANLYRTFGGTSGAGPHVAGAAALLLQRFPTESSSALRERLLRGARTDGEARDPDPSRWGRGRLDLPGALGLTTTDGAPLSLRLLAPRYVLVGQDLTMAPELQDDGPLEALRVRWDLDYDGVWDTPWEAPSPRRIDTLRPGLVAVKVEARDGDGWLRRATARVEVVTRFPTDAGADAGSTAPGAPGARAPGCGCGAGGGPGPRGIVWLAIFAALARLPLRRGRRYSPGVDPRRRQCSWDSSMRSG